MSSKRKTRKITIYMLANHLGLTPSTVYQWDKERRDTAMHYFSESIKAGRIEDPREK